MSFMKVYISYAHSDEKIAKLVATQLRHTGLEVWEASNEILPGNRILSNLILYELRRVMRQV